MSFGERTYKVAVGALHMVQFFGGFTLGIAGIVKLFGTSYLVDLVLGAWWMVIWVFAYTKAWVEREA